MKIIGMDVPPPDPRVLTWEEHTGMLLHEAALLFPDLSAEAYCNLKNNIEAHGLLEPIWVTRKGWLLDGRHRKRICNELGIECPERVYEGKDPFGFVASLNLHRRHLTTRERAEVAAELATRKSGYRDYPTKKSGAQVCAPEAQSLTNTQAAKLMRVSPRSVQSAKARKAAKLSVVKGPKTSAPTPAPQPPADWKQLLTVALRAALSSDVSIKEIRAHIRRVLDD